MEKIDQLHRLFLTSYVMSSIVIKQVCRLDKVFPLTNEIGVNSYVWSLMKCCVYIAKTKITCTV